jgi:hypothetical protein
MEEKRIVSPSPIFDEKELEKKGRRLIYLGTAESGVIIRIAKSGIEFNGYFTGYNGTKYAVMREFSEIAWEDLDILKATIGKKKKKENAPEEPDKIDTPDEEYLSKLPIVTLNGTKFYIDPERRERRPVRAPNQVFSFRKVFEK